MRRLGRVRHLGIRTRIAGGSLLIAILLSLIAGIVLNAQVQRIVRDGTVAVLKSDSAPYVVALQNEPSDAFDPPGPSQLVAVIDPDGAVPIDTLPAELSESVRGFAGDAGARTISADGVEYILYRTSVQVGAGTWAVVAARPAEQEDTVADQLRNLLFGMLAIIDMAVGATAWVLTSASLAPVTRLRESAQALSTGPGSDLLPVGGVNDEIARLARTLNELIVRLRASADRERQLVSDASHELRTPLAILRAQLEVARAESSSVEQLTRDITSAERSAARLAALVASLLELSTIQSADSPGGSATRDELEREVQEAADRARFRSMGTGIDVRYASSGSASGPDGVFDIRSEDFGRIADNLVSNSLAALGETGQLDIALRDVGDGLQLTVADTGGGLPAEFEPVAFDRFSRVDKSRAHQDGSGLGLAIVAALAHRAGGVVTLRNRPGVGLAVVVTVPRVVRMPGVTPH